MTTLHLPIKRGPGRPKKVAAVETPPGKQPMTWQEFKMAVRDRPISRCWFPSPPIPMLEIGNNVMARVLDGEPAYQLSSGEIVELKE